MFVSQNLTQKQIERWQFDRFIDLCCFEPPEEIKETEEPDFIIRQDGRSVGVELTDLYWEPAPGSVPHQAIESLRARAVDKACSLYSAKGLPALHVSVHFNPSYVPHKKDVSRLAHSVATLIANNVPEEGERFEEDYNWVNRNYFPEEICHVGAWRLPGEDRSLFTSPGAAYVPKLTKNDIERTLVQKEPKISNYRKKCDEIWLVINCDGGQLSTVFEHDDSVLLEEFYSDFDRAFLLRHVAGRVHELKVNQA